MLLLSGISISITSAAAAVIIIIKIKIITIADKNGTINSTYSRSAETTINIQLANPNLHTEKS